VRGLTARLTASYILLAAVVLAGAGLLLQTALAGRLKAADEADITSRLDAAARLVSMTVAVAPSRPADALTAGLRASFPNLTVTALPQLSDLPAGQPLYDYRALTSGDSLGQGPGLHGVVQTVDGAPLERAVLLYEGAQVRAAFRVVWQDPAALRSSALGQALLGAGALALLVAIFMALWFGHTLTAPINHMADAAGRLAGGAWETTLPDSGPTELRRLSEAFRTMAARLEVDFSRLQGDRAKLQHWAAEVAHELKTPIAALKTYHELLLDGEQENPGNRAELLRRGAGQVDRLEYLARFLVDMARLEAHTAQLDLQELDLSALAAERVAAMRPAAEQAGVNLVLDGVPASVLADPQRVGQALDNLLQNAIRWSPSGGRVVVTITERDQQAKVAVCDEGPGIPEELLPRLFDPFVRGPGSRGMGLGLALVKAVAHSHGGSVAAHNSGGAVFTLTLPLRQTM